MTAARIGALWRLWWTTRRIRASGAFDPDWYRRRYPDVVAAGIDPLRHYVLWGCRDKRLPNPIFDSGWYLAHYFPGDADPPNPLVDYLRHVRRGARQPNRWLDPEWYRRAAGVSPGRDPMSHYLAAGRDAAAPGPDFDAADLLRRFPDLGGHAPPLGFYLGDYRVAGRIDACTAYSVAGWASRRVGPAIVLRVIVNGRVEGEARPWIARADISAFAPGALGFTFVFPTRLGDGDIVELRDEVGEVVVGCAATYAIPALGVCDTLGGSRAAIAAAFLVGRGVEIGAFTQPTDLPPDRSVVFFDRYPAARLRDFHDETWCRPLMEPHYVGDASTLDGLPDGAFDFVIANHVMEHLEDPILFLERVARKLVVGGRAMIGVPEMRHCADFRRVPTTFDHLVAEHERGPEQSRLGHFLEAALCDGFAGEAAQERAAATDLDTTLVHYHAWTAESFVAFIHAAIARYAIPLDLLHESATVHDLIVVLEKAGAPPGDSPEPTPPKEEISFGP